MNSIETLDVCTTTPDATVLDAIRLLDGRNLSALIVTENGLYMGLVTERDCTKNAVIQGRSSKDSYVRDIMNDYAARVSPDDSTDTCMELMLQNNIRHLPVVAGERLVGIISMRDVVNSTLLEHRSTIENLMDYITDSPMVSRAMM